MKREGEQEEGEEGNEDNEPEEDEEEKTETWHQSGERSQNASVSLSPDAHGRQRSTT